MTNDERLVDAIQNEREDDAIRAIEAGANVNAMADADNSIINLAISKGLIGVVEKLVECGAATSPADDAFPPQDNMPPLVVASYGETSEAANIVALLARVTDPDDAWLPGTEGETGLTTALNPDCCPDDVIAASIVQAFVDAGADVEKPRADGFRPLMLAVTRAETMCTEILLNAGANVLATRVGHSDVTAATVAEYRGCSKNLALVVGRGASDPVDHERSILESGWDDVVSGFNARLDSGWRAQSDTAADWFDDYVAAYNKRSRAASEVLAALTERVGSALVAPVLAQWQLMGEGNYSGWWEYELLSAKRSLADHEMMGDLYRDNDWENLEPRELDTSAQQIKPKWWHDGWVILAQDSGGNLICVDHDPDLAGVRGQVIMWEVHAGPVGPIAVSWSAFIQAYAADVAKGNWACDDGGVYRL